MTEFKPGDRVVVVGVVTDVMAHHSGVIGVGISFGTGVERILVVPDDIVQPAVLVEMATAFDVMPFDLSRRIREIQVVLRSRDPEAWAIVSEGHNLARDGEWEYESLPSSRSEDFFARCRWPSAIEAIRFAEEHMQRYPSGYKD